MQRLWVGAGALAGLGAVAMAAMAAHGSLDEGALGVMNAAVQMQGWHALALLFCGVWAERGGRLADAAAAAFVVGLLCFCGGIYGLVLAGIRVAGVVPTGGTLLMLGWLLLLLSAFRRT